MKYEKKLVEDHWSRTDCSASEKNFYCFPPIRSRSCRLIFDEYDARRKDWCEYWTVEKYLKDEIPFEKCLSICCGFGEVERILAKLNLAKKIIGTDIAPGAIEEANKRAKDESLDTIEYYVSDLNQEKLPEEEYDIIWANGALHHIRDLDVVIPMLANSLKDGGYLISNEYVGPKYQQLGKRQQEIINAAKHILPIELRQKSVCYRPYGRSIILRAIRYFKKRLDIMNNDICEKLWEMPSVEYFLNTDPSECVNSTRIIPILNKCFDEVEVKYYDGSILLYALDSSFFNNFNPNNNKHIMILETLFYIEDALIAAGELPRDNAHIICRKH